MWQPFQAPSALPPAANFSVRYRVALPVLLARTKEMDSVLHSSIFCLSVCLRLMTGAVVSFELYEICTAILIHMLPEFEYTRCKGEVIEVTKAYSSHSYQQTNRYGTDGVSLFVSLRMFLCPSAKFECATNSLRGNLHYCSLRSARKIHRNLMPFVRRLNLI